MNYLTIIEVHLTLELLQLGHKKYSGSRKTNPTTTIFSHKADVIILTLVRSLISSKSVLTIFAGERRIVCNENLPQVFHYFNVNFIKFNNCNKTIVKENK